jgi:hypothetical protein
VFRDKRHVERDHDGDDNPKTNGGADARNPQRWFSVVSSGESARHAQHRPAEKQ